MVDDSLEVGRLPWANAIINDEYGPRMKGPGGDIGLANRLPYIEAAAIIKLDDPDPKRFGRLQNELMSRGLGIAEWTLKVEERVRKIGTQRNIILRFAE